MCIIGGFRPKRGNVRRMAEILNVWTLYSSLQSCCGFILYRCCLRHLFVLDTFSSPGWFSFLFYFLFLHDVSQVFIYLFFFLLFTRNKQKKWRRSCSKKVWTRLAHIVCTHQKGRWKKGYENVQHIRTMFYYIYVFVVATRIRRGRGIFEKYLQFKSTLCHFRNYVFLGRTIIFMSSPVFDLCPKRIYKAYFGPEHLCVSKEMNIKNFVSLCIHNNEKSSVEI